MKPKSVAPQSAVMAVDRKLHNTWVYIKRHWQLYLLFLMPAVLLTLVFRYIPMGGVLIAFQKYNPFKGIWGSEWVGFKNFTRFLSSPDFMRYLINTLKLSVYGLLWGFPIPILLAFLLNRIKSNKIKQKVQLVLYTKQDKAILYCGYALLAVFLIAIIVPMVYIVIASFMDPVTLQNKGISFDFSKWSLDAYERVISDKQIWVGFKNAVLYSVIFTVISVAVTMLAAYPMSLPDFKGKKFFNTLFVITMFFNGGLIPTYLLINNIGLLDSMWAVILPGAFSVWNMIIARTYYQGIPRELREAADVDGASEMRYFFNILLPVCMPVVAVLALWQFVAMWNSYFDAMIYLNSASKQPLQLVLRSILIQSQPESGMIADIQSTAERAKMAELLKYATIIISSLPLLVMYPFFQKYFDAGIMAGSVKG